MFSWPRNLPPRRPDGKGENFARIRPTEVVAVPEADGCHLFELRHWPARSRHIGDYVVYRSGLIRRGGRLTGWHSRDLKDTGHTMKA